MSKIDLSIHLKDLMEAKQISSSRLSKDCGIPASTLSTYLSGKKATYSAEHLFKLAQYFSVTADQLLFGTKVNFEHINSVSKSLVFEGWVHVSINKAIPSKK